MALTASQAGDSAGEGAKAVGSAASDTSTILALHRLRGPDPLSAVRPAAAPGFSKFILKYDALVGAAVLLGSRSGGGPFAVASDVLPESDLIDAEVAGYSGLVGPSLASFLQLAIGSGRPLSGFVP